MRPGGCSGRGHVGGAGIQLWFMAARVMAGKAARWWPERQGDRQAGAHIELACVAVGLPIWGACMAPKLRGVQLLGMVILDCALPLQIVWYPSRLCVILRSHADSLRRNDRRRTSARCEMHNLHGTRPTLAPPLPPSRGGDYKWKAGGVTAPYLPQFQPQRMRAGATPIIAKEECLAVLRTFDCTLCRQAMLQQAQEPTSAYRWLRKVQLKRRSG